MPVASMPRMRGNLTFGEWPCRVNSSERLSPTALIWMRTWPGDGVGMGSSVILRTSGPPGLEMTAAFMVAMMAVICSC